MAKPTPEQLAEFKRYEAENAGTSVSLDALRKVIDDDVKAEDEMFKKRFAHNRNYNSAPGKVGPGMAE